MGKICIRNTIQCGDIGSIVYLHGRYAAFENGYDHTFEAYVAKPLSKFVLSLNEREQIWVVESAGKVMGSIVISQVNEFTAQLRWFILAPSLRKKKLGQKLLSLALSFARESGYRSVQLQTESGLDKALSLYRSFGFKLVSSSKVHLWGKELEEQTYALSLNT